MYAYSIRRYTGLKDWAYALPFGVLPALRVLCTYIYMRSLFECIKGFENWGGLVMLTIFIKKLKL